MTEKSINAQIEKISPLTDSIVQLILKPTQYIDYEAGQYLKIILEDEALSFSIANAPLGAHQYELHIRHSKDNPCHQQLFAYIKAHGSIPVALPFGTCSINHLEPKRPILFLAGGTGVAPVHAMIEQLLTLDDSRMFELYWVARSQNDLYLDEKIKNWQIHSSRFNYFSSISDENKDNLTVAVLNNHLQDLKDWQIVISGPFDMVYSTRDTLVQAGVSPAHIFSDALTYEGK
ncbi:MAG: NAD(P)H-flavin reductase [Legionella sp.]|nr:NAD(P)H-flavin reductase [Legionella sp.]